MIVRSTGYGLSSMNTKSCDAIFTVLLRHYRRVSILIVNSLLDFQSLVDLKPDLVFLGMKFVLKDEDLGLQNSEKIWISDYLDEHNITYTGSNQKAHDFGVNKPLAKQRVMDSNLQTSQFHVISQGLQFSEGNIHLKFPVFVKPTSRGGGLGIDSNSVANNFAELQSKISLIASTLNSDSLVEEYLMGREFSVGLRKDEDSDNYYAMPIELIAPLDENGARLLSGEVKSSNSERVLEVAEGEIRNRVCELALKVFIVLGGRDYGRIDIRMDNEDVPHFLEANLMPNLENSYGSFPKACLMNSSLGYESMILTIVRLAFLRQIPEQNIDEAEDTEIVTLDANIVLA